MTDLTSLSDDELKAMYAAPAAPDLSKLSDAELQAAYKAHAAGPRPDTSVTGALSEGARGVAQGFGKTIKHYFNSDAGDAVLNNKHVQSDPKYKSASQGFMYPEDGADNHVMGLDWSKAPRALIEQAPALALDVGAAMTLKKLGPLGSWISNAVSFGGRTAGNEAEKRAAERTGDPNAEPNAEDKLIGLKSTAEQAVLNRYGTKGIVSPSKVVDTGAKGVAQAAGNVVKAAGTEGLTNAAQEAISQAEAKQTLDPSKFDAQALKGNLALGAAGGGMFASPKGAKDTLASIKHSDQTPGASTARVANRMIEHAGDVDALGNEGKAFEALVAAHTGIQTELKTASAGISNPSKDAANAIQRAKDGNALTEKELAAVDAEGNAQVSDLVRQASSVANLKESGNYDPSSKRFGGGLGELARKHAKGALLSVGGVAGLAHAASHGGAGIDTALSAIPGVGKALAAGYLGYKGLKLAEGLLGTRSPGQTFAEKFGNADEGVRTDAPLNQSPTGPKVVPQNSLTSPQPWGPVEPEPARFKPDTLEPGIGKIVEKIQRQKQQQTAREAMPLLRQLAERSKPAPEAPGPDVNAMNEQVKSALLMAAARRKIEGQRQAESEAAVSPMIDEVGGLDEVRNPAMGKRAQELISAANALRRLRHVPEADGAPPMQPQPVRENVPEPEPFVLPESPHVFKEPKEAAEAIYAEALAGGKEIRHAEGFKAGTARRLAGEEAIYNTISNSMPTVKERGDFHKYLAALWGSDSPEVVQKVREHMLAEFPQHAEAINKHLSDEAIKGLWTKPAKKKLAK